VKSETWNTNLSYRREPEFMNSIDGGGMTGTAESGKNPSFPRKRESRNAHSGAKRRIIDVETRA
jgi:hypothetical protein